MPLGKLGYHLPRTISNAIDSQSRDIDEPASFHLRQRIAEVERRQRQTKASRSTAKTASSGDVTPPRPVFRLGGTLIATGLNGQDAGNAPQESSKPILETDFPSESLMSSKPTEGIVELRGMRVAPREYESGGIVGISEPVEDDDANRV